MQNFKTGIHTNNYSLDLGSNRVINAISKVNKPMFHSLGDFIHS